MPDQPSAVIRLAAVTPTPTPDTLPCLYGKVTHDPGNTNDTQHCSRSWSPPHDPLWRRGCRLPQSADMSHRAELLTPLRAPLANLTLPRLRASLASLTLLRASLASLTLLRASLARQPPHRREPHSPAFSPLRASLAGLLTVASLTRQHPHRRGDATISRRCCELDPPAPLQRRHHQPPMLRA